LKFSKNTNTHSIDTIYGQISIKVYKNIYVYVDKKQIAKNNNNNNNLLFILYYTKLLSKISIIFKTIINF
jgi:hypothetical protein